MKRILAGLLVMATVNLFGQVASGSGSPLIATHQVTKYEKGATSATVGYTLHLVNAGDTSISNITLAVIGSRQFAAKTVTLEAGTIAPKRSADLSFAIEAPLALPKGRLLGQPLYLIMKYRDSSGKTVDIPAKSNPGGAP